MKTPSNFLSDSKLMNIAFLLRPWPIYGGGETVTITLANEFVKRGHTVHVLYTRLVSDKKTLFIEDKIISCLVPGIIADEHQDFSMEDVLHANVFLKEYIVQNQINIVIDQWWPAESLKGVKSMCGVIKCLHLSLFLPCEYENVRWHGKGIIYKLMGKRLYDHGKCHRACQKVEEFLPYVHKYIFLSKFFSEDYLRFRKKNENKQLDFCNNPLPFDDFISEQEIACKENIVLFVGRMYDSHKKVTKILSTWKQIELTGAFDDWKLILVGDGPDKPMFEKYAQILNLKQYEFTGYQLPKPYYRKAKIFLMTSTHEGWGMTLVESQQNAVVPIVRDTFSSVHDIITDGENGRIIAANDSQGFTDALTELMANDAKRERMGRNGLISCQRFSVKNVADKWEKFFSEITKS